MEAVLSFILKVDLGPSLEAVGSLDWLVDMEDIVRWGGALLALLLLCGWEWEPGMILSSTSVSLQD